MATFARSSLIDFSRYKWLKPLDASLLLDIGDRSPDLLSVPTKDAQEVLSKTVRLVLDLPRNSTPLVVWTQGDSELLVHSDQTRIGFSSGVVALRITVECEEHGKLVVPVPIGVGTSQSPTGLIMSTFEDLEGPTELVDAWRDALIAFAWEALLEIARVICAEVGNDKRGLPLVPGSIGASPDRLLLQPVSRFSLLPGA
ncbi:hypothetical protein [Marinobacter sp. 2_MG-2023]|uniref:hypothetical protein n=1 Tax=Marinobacter sp. 2_MG-2023 TaxID=3062679 RepID=UPI0026E191FB|nr:hypothetical protein [Marinobacter sp. 2_MG-2023]MDO6442338.1 hypothetical protein [Marinobacter sp. 2_MG-2023]